MSKVYVVAAKRTAIGSFLGTLSPVKPGELGAKVVKNIIEETGIDPANIDEVKRIKQSIDNGTFKESFLPEEKEYIVK